jgi:DUF971 family protein
MACNMPPQLETWRAFRVARHDNAPETAWRRNEAPLQAGISPETGSLPYKIAALREAHLEVAFDDGARFSLPAEYLRVESPSAEVQGHGPGQRQVVAGRRHVGIIGIEPVGNYAVRLLFDDLHDTGIYSWEYLHEIGREREQRWGAYLDALKAKGLSREPERR